MRRSRVFQDSVQLVEVWLLKSDVIPVFLECLISKLLYIFYDFVDKYR